MVSACATERGTFHELVAPRRHRRRLPRRSHRRPRAARPRLRGRRVRALERGAQGTGRRDRHAPLDHPLLRGVERARPPGAHELPLLVVDHGVPRPHGRLRRPALPPRLGGRPLRAGRPRGHRPIRGRVQPHPRPAGVRGRHLVHLPHDASPGRRAALRGLCRVAGDDPGIRPRAGELRGAPRRSHLLRAPGRTRPRLPDPEPRGAPRAGAAARELCLLPQLR